MSVDLSITTTGLRVVAWHHVVVGVLIGLGIGLSMVEALPTFGGTVEPPGGGLIGLLQKVM